MSGVSGDFTGDHEKEVKRLEKEQCTAEANSFGEQINNLLKKDDALREKGLLPIDSESKFFDVTQDGRVLAHVVDKIKEGAINLKAVKMNVDKANLNVPGAKDAWEIAANNGLVLDAAKKMGCKIQSIGPEDLIEGNHHLILAVVWQLIRAHLMRSVNLMSHPELIRLLQPGEKIDKLLNMRAEDIIKRWFNYHLKRAGPDENGEIRQIGNFGSDVKDSSAWVTLFKQIAPNESEEADIEDVMECSDLRERANKLLEVAEELDCRQFTTANDIVNGYERLNLAFTATIFNEHIGITLPTEDEIERLYRELEDLKKRCLDCNKKREELEQQVASLEAEKTALLSSLEDLEKQVKDKSDAVVARGIDITDMLEQKNAEIARLKALLADQDTDLATKLQQLEAGLSSFKDVENDLNSKMQSNKDTISSLEGQIQDLERATKDLQDLADGKGQSVEDMKKQLEEKEKEIASKSDIINNHTQNAEQLLGSHADKLKVEVPKIEGDDDKSRLNALLEANTILIKHYEKVLADKRAEFKRHEDEERRQLEELNREVGDYLGEGQSSAEDAISNMKRLLQLMIEKCKKQATHIQTQQVTIEKKNAINTVMGAKICDIAQQQRDGKGKKKKPKK